jgi:selenocysteine-specific elongation factor
LQLVDSLSRLSADLREHPFAAPDAARLHVLGLDHRALATAERAGRLIRIADTVVLLPGADREAARLLSQLPQPFTVSDARLCLETTRRVILPLLNHLDRLGLTKRLADNRRQSALTTDTPL